MSSFTDKQILDWIDEFVNTGVIESAFEIDGGVHVTLSNFAEMKEVAYRDQNSFRAGVCTAMLASGLKPEDAPTLEELAAVWHEANPAGTDTYIGIRAVVERCGWRIKE